MDIINNIDWFINSVPNSAVNNDTKTELTQIELDTVVFDDSTKENVKFSLPLNDNLLFYETRELARPISIEQILTLVYKFYKEPLKKENMDKAFLEMEEWKDDIIDYYDGDINRIKNYDVFTACAGY